MNNIKLAIRNLLRNRRRSLTTILAMVIGVIAMLLFGGFISSIYYGLETGIVRSQGHLHLYPQGYLEYGSSRPTDYYINDYQNIIDKITNNKVLKEKIEVITPIVSLTGIAGNYAANSSKTFIARGVIPAAQNKMQNWDQHSLHMKPIYSALNDNGIDQGVVGIGMAKMLNLCSRLHIPNCQDRPIKEIEGTTDTDILYLQSLAEEENEQNISTKQQGAQIDLLASTGSGAPNAISLNIIKAQLQGNKVLDDSFIAMHLQQAQKLVFADNKRVSAIIIQLKNTAFMLETQAYLENFLKGIDSKQAFEVKNYTEFNKEFSQIVGMFVVIFIFVALMMSLVVLFTTINTLTMSVMERISEIGSLRAMGLRRSAVLSQFLLEGAVIGVVGATMGVLITIALAQLFNQLGFSWTPPGSAEPRTLQILLFANPTLIIGTWVLIACVATFSSLMPARFAAKMNIVNAIRKA